MITFEDAVQNCQDFSNDSTSTTKTFFIRLLNTGYKYILADFGRKNIERTYTMTTRALSSPIADSDRVYQLPPDFNFMKSIKIKIGNQQYPIQEEESQEMMDYVTRVPFAGIPSLYFVKPRFGVGGAEVLFDPIPNAAGYTVTLVYEATDADLSTLNVPSGARLTFTNDNVTVASNVAVFTNNMIGNYIRSGDGDGFWYKINSFTDSMHVTLENYYHGSTITTVNWSINQIFNLPEEMQILPVYYAMWHFYEAKKDANQALKYQGYFDTGLQKGKDRWATQSRGNVIRSKRYSHMWRRYPSYFPQGPGPIS